jgi:signal transduction histidine kinase
VEDTMALRASVIEAIDGERQRIVRDLHDGAQQRLVALRVQLGLALEKMDHQKLQYEEMLRLGDEMDSAIQELRDLSRQFLMPFITHNGVGPAIRAVTRGWPIDVQVHDEGLGRHEAETEVTAYNCCLEALRNTLEHAGEHATVRVRLYESAGSLRFEVSDNGVGFDPATTQPGVGLTTMADRALLRGGWVRVTSSPGRGVVVAGTIPDFPHEVHPPWVN